MMNAIRFCRWLSIGFLFFLVGCASQTFLPDEAPSYIVLRDRTEFYRFGPLQEGPPDALLPKNTSVRLLRREFGYSLVNYGEAQSGYVANDDIVPDPDPQSADAALESETGFGAEGEEVDAMGPILPIVEPPLPAPDFSGELPDDPPH